jgi:superfamily II DNA/RNA helicase
MTLSTPSTVKVRTRVVLQLRPDLSLRIFVPQQHPVQPVSPAQALPGFAALGVPAPVVASLEASGIASPFPIQTATLPDALAGRDVLGRGRTGSGKTIAFAIPTVAALAASRRSRRPGQARALILVPTRELANQVQEVVAPLATALGLRTMTIFGGVGQGPQVATLRKGVDIVIATPGRLEDLIKQRHVRLDDVEVTVLDEADHMADLGFLPAVKRLLDATPTSAQRLLFSATLDRGVDVLVKRYLKNPVTHSVDSAASEVPQMTHHVFNVSDGQKMSVVRELVSGQGRTLAFTRTKHGAKKLAKQLTEAGVPAVDLHGNLSQGARQRNLAAFGEGTVRVLVATDIAARGIDVEGVSHVINYDLPNVPESYVHRIGRTARAGKTGVAISFCDGEERAYLRDIEALIRIRIPVMADHPWHAGPMPAQPQAPRRRNRRRARNGEPGDRRAPVLSQRNPVERSQHANLRSR